MTFSQTIFCKVGSDYNKHGPTCSWSLTRFPNCSQYQDGELLLSGKDDATEITFMMCPSVYSVSHMGLMCPQILEYELTSAVKLNQDYLITPFFEKYGR